MFALIDKMPIYGLPQFDSFDAFAAYVCDDLQAAGVIYDDNTLVGWMEDYASTHEQKYGVDPYDLPSHW